MFKEKLMTALNDAISNFNEGADENSSVVKAASAHGFNPEQTQRLVEAFNTTKTICFYKHASDRSSDFPTADPNEVIAKLFGKVETEEKAAADDVYEDYSYYEQSHPELEKTAKYLEADFDPWAGFGDDEFTDKEAEARIKVTEYQGLRDAVKACDNAALIASNHYDLTIQKVAEALRRELYHNESLADEMFTYGKTLGKMASAAVDAILERANVKEAKDLRVSSFDHTHAMLASSVKSAAESLQEAGTMIAQKEQLSKMADELSVELGISPKQEEDELDGFVPKSAADKKKKDKTMVGSALNSMSSQTGKEVAKSVVEKAKTTLQAPDAANKKFQDRARNMYRTMLLQRLIVTDPILKGADEDSVIKAYESLVQIAPEVSLQEDVTRSILREAVTTASISPYDAKSYVDLDSAIKKQLAATSPATEGKK